MQVIGYLVLENGIFLFGVITVVGTPLLVELGRAARRLCRGVRDGHRDLPHQPRIRVDGYRPVDRAAGLDIVFAEQSLIAMLVLPVAGALLSPGR